LDPEREAITPLALALAPKKNILQFIEVIYMTIQMLGQRPMGRAKERDVSRVHLSQVGGEFLPFTEKINSFAPPKACSRSTLAGESG
jgi:hypothetical protein